MAASVERIKADPPAYARHIRAQVAKLWRLYPYPRNYQHSYGTIKAVSLLSDGWLIPLGFLGMFLYWKRSDRVPLFAVLVFGGTGVYGLISAVLRYRMPFMAVLIILSAPVLAAAYEKWIRKA